MSKKSDKTPKSDSAIARYTPDTTSMVARRQSRALSGRDPMALLPDGVMLVAQWWANPKVGDLYVRTRSPEGAMGRWHLEIEAAFIVLWNGRLVLVQVIENGAWMNQPRRVDLGEVVDIRTTLVPPAELGKLHPAVRGEDAPLSGGTGGGMIEIHVRLDAIRETVEGWIADVDERHSVLVNPVEPAENPLDTNEFDATAVWGTGPNPGAMVASGPPPLALSGPVVVVDYDEPSQNEHRGVRDAVSQRMAEMQEQLNAAIAEQTRALKAETQQRLRAERAEAQLIALRKEVASAVTTMAMTVGGLRIHLHSSGDPTRAPGSLDPVDDHDAWAPPSNG